MSHPTLPHLFSPIEIRNRVFVPGHNTALSEGGRIGDAIAHRVRPLPKRV